jgi:hypothetical protein
MLKTKRKTARWLARKHQLPGGTSAKKFQPGQTIKQGNNLLSRMILRCEQVMYVSGHIIAYGNTESAAQAICVGLLPDPRSSV